jgi:hypothetical protein
MDLAELTLATFEPHVGDAFTTAAADGLLELMLSAAQSAGEWPGGREPFRLVFHGPREPLLPQSIYRLEHAQLGALEIFIVPVGQDADATIYEAIFT